jgi:hypothetical protein
VGTNFSPLVTVTIDGALCADLKQEQVNGTSVYTCLIPRGTGADRVVFASIASGSSVLTSVAKPFLSYARPQVVALKGCPSPKVFVSDLYNCSRMEANLLVVQGRNFGDAGARVVVGGEECLPVCHGAILNPGTGTCNVSSSALDANTLLSCYFPPGKAQNRSVQIIQQNAQLNLATNTISFQQCTPGTFEQDLSCSLVNQGPDLAMVNQRVRDYVPK